MSDFEVLLDENPEEVNLFTNNIQIGEVGTITLQRHVTHHPNIQLLELKGSTIGHKGAEYLATALNKNKCIKHLGLARNNINNSGAVAVLKSLMASDIQTLDLEWNCLQDATAYQLADLLISPNCKLMAVTLERNDIRGEGAAVLATALTKNKTLKNLNLGFNKVSTLGATHLGDMLEANRTLLTLNLAMNGIYPDGARSIAEGLCKNTTLRSLNLQSNQAIDAFADLGANMKYPPTLRELNFSSNRLQSQLAVGFAHGIRSAKGLIGLSLAKCGIGEPAITPVFEALTTLVSLVTLDISHCGLSAASATLIATFLSSCPSVRSMLLDDNRIDTTGGEIIGEAISRCSALTVLSMNGCLIGAAGVRAIADSLRSRRGLPMQELRLAHNHMGDDALYVLCDTLNLRMGDGECELTAFDVSGNDLSGRSCSSLARVLKQHTKLASVTIRDNKLSEELSDTSFLTLEKAIEYAGRDVLKSLQQNPASQGQGGNSPSAAHHVSSSDPTAAVYSNFNGTSASFVGSLATVAPGTMQKKRKPGESGATMTVSLYKNNDGDDEDGAQKALSPVRVPHGSPPRHHSAANSDAHNTTASSMHLSKLSNAEITPGLAPSISTHKHRIQLHDVDQNVSLLPINETQLRIKFTELDVDSNGYLDANEFALLYHQMDPCAVDSGKRAKRLVKEYAAKDGKIYFEQFSILMLQLLKM